MKKFYHMASFSSLRSMSMIGLKPNKNPGLIIKNYDPSNVILMDNSLYSFMNQPSNGMLVNSFYTSHKDTQLISAKNFLINHIFPCDDIRKECEKWYHFSKLFYKGTSKEIKENEKL